MSRHSNEFLGLFDQAVANRDPCRPLDVWGELVRRHEADLTVPARLVGRAQPLLNRRGSEG